MDRAPLGALLLGADYRALGVVRSLGRHRVPTRVLWEPGEPLAATSRYADRSLRWPTEDPDARIRFLLGIADTHDLRDWALIPSADDTAALIARSYEELQDAYVLSSPNWEALRWAYDKRLTYQLADQVGVSRPMTIQPRTLDEASALPFPVILKPAVKPEFNALTAAKAWRVDSLDELAARFEEARALTEPDALLVQELIPGNGHTQFSYTALCLDGKPLASLTARRTRQYPADFGRASTYVETVDCPELIEPSRQLLSAIRYTGLIEVEYKRDPRDGEFKLLDMNPRVWGWQSLCPRAGVDFPWLLWQMLCGGSVSPSYARPGIGWLRMTTDTPTALRELFARRLTLREYLRSLRRPRESAIFSWDDPLPGIAEVPVLAYMAARRLLNGGSV